VGQLPLDAEPALIRLRVLVIGRVQNRRRSQERVRRQSQRRCDCLDFIRSYVREFVQCEVIQVDPNQLQLLIDRLVGVRRRNRERKLDRKISRRNAEIIEGAGEQQQRGARIVNTSIAAYDRLPIAPRVPGKTKPRPKLFGTRLDFGWIDYVTRGKLEALNLANQRCVVGLRSWIILSFPS